jgi:16S rRNA G966 N2-methylase RsmD
MTRSDFIYDVFPETKFVRIVDLDKGRMSVTNDIENVIEEIATQEQISPLDYKFIYQDSEGQVDGFNYKDKSHVLLFAKSFMEAEMMITLNEKNHMCNDQGSIYILTDGARIEATPENFEKYKEKISGGSVCCSICGKAAIDEAYK